MMKRMKKWVIVDLMKTLESSTLVRRKRVEMKRAQKLNKTKPHCGNMFLGLKQGKRVEPLNFHSPIAKKLAQVHTPMPEGTSVGKGHGMEINK